MASSTTAPHLYQPIYTPSTSSYNPSINPVHSTHAAHFRRLYDIYRLLLQRGDIERAKRAYALVVRCREFDWAMNWRDGIAMVALPRSPEEEDDGNEEAGGPAGRSRREEELKARYLRETLAVHSRGVTSFRHVREVRFEGVCSRQKSCRTDTDFLGSPPHSPSLYSASSFSISSPCTTTTKPYRRSSCALSSWAPHRRLRLPQISTSPTQG